MIKTRFITAIAAVLTLPQLVSAQTPDAASVKASDALRFDRGEGGSHTLSWFTRERDGVETTIQRVVTPVKVGGSPRLEVYTNTEIRQNKVLIQRRAEKRVYNASDMRPITSRVDIEFIDGAALQTGWRELKYDGQRVQGAMVDQKQARRQLEKELPADALLVPYVAISFLQNDQLEPGRTISFKTFNEESEAVEDGYIKVLKTEKISVAGQSYDALKVEMKVGRTTATAHYTPTVPRILLRLRDNTRFMELTEMSK